MALTTAVSRDLQYRARLAGVLGGGAALRERIGPRGDGALARGLWLPIIALLVAGAVLLSLGAYGIRLLIG